MSHEGEKDAIVHLVPFTLDYEGPSKVSTYFIIEESTTSKEMKSSFRGKRLFGTRYQMKESVKGHVLKKMNNIYKSHGEFEKISIWDYDQTPSIQSNDTIKALGYMSLMNDIMQFLLF